MAVLKVSRCGIRFFAEHHVTGLFSEGSYASAGGDMDVLKAYLVGNMLMEPGLDPSELISSWLTAYFGSANPCAVESFSSPPSNPRVYNMNDSP